MRVHDRFSTIEPGIGASVCSIGTFDGVHLGHQHLISAAVRDARSAGARAVVVTFDPHPREVLTGTPVRYLTSRSEKTDAIAALGVDDLLIYPFTREVASVSAAEFMGVLKRALNLSLLWIGPDFSLGYKREGDATFLAGLGALLDYQLRVAEPLQLGDRAVSSSRIRESLGRGDIADAARCLGRPYALELERRDAGAWCAGEQRVLPHPGEYPARIGAQAGGVIFAASPCDTRLTGALSAYNDARVSVTLE
jgi:riboflavin kinase / FMN adenylyltransferase